MFTINDILYEDNHLIIVNKHVGDLVQSDPDGTEAIEDQIKAMIKIRDHTIYLISSPRDLTLCLLIPDDITGAALSVNTRSLAKVAVANTLSMLTKHFTRW